jgi:uncharacterized membrane protein YhaH (DUF805 family)
MIALFILIWLICIFINFLFYTKIGESKGIQEVDKTPFQILLVLSVILAPLVALIIVVINVPLYLYYIFDNFIYRRNKK